MTETSEISTPIAPKRSLAEMVADVKSRTPAEQPAVSIITNSRGTTSSKSVSRTRRAPNGTRRFKNVMIKLEPEMIGELDRVGAEMRLSRSELLRQAAQRVWLSENANR